MTKLTGPVHPHLIGEASFSTLPGDEPQLYGSAVLEGPSEVEVRSYQTFRLRYTTGKLGIDDTGAIRVAFRMISDAGPLQFADPAAPNYVHATSTGEGRLDLRYDPIGGQRPWNEVLTVYQRGGYLRPGETIEIIFGDTSGGSPGLLMQSFQDSGRVFRVMADVQATGVFVPLPPPFPSVAVVGGPLHRHVAVLPTLRRPGEQFHLGIKAEDIWGNPTSQGSASFRLETTMPVRGLPDKVDFDSSSGAMILEGLSCDEEGTLAVVLIDDKGLRTEAGPLVIREGETAHFWGDLHGQTGETVGTNTIEHYFDFARNIAFLDVTSHQGNDFQINASFWKHLNRLTAQADEPGRFTVFPGYEWSGNTAVGGDHNVYYLEEGARIYRCSHALVEDRSDADTDAHTLTDLYARLGAEPTDSFMYAHVGGRYANIHYDHDPRREPAVEIHSAWGSFEWLLTDGFPLRRRVGVVCNSDGHKGRPGASFPGASVFGAYGGLTCFISGENSRAAIAATIRRRHTYGTSGPRIMVDLNIALAEGSMLYLRDPRAEPEAPAREICEATMGDIVRVSGDRAEAEISVSAPAGILSLELRDGGKTLETVRPYSTTDLGRRFRVLWSGAEYRGRGRNTNWQGRADLHGATIGRFEAVNRLNPEMLLEQRGSRSVVWKSVTTGNMMGFDIWLKDEPDDARLDIHTNHGNVGLKLSELGMEPAILDAGGLERKITVWRLPNGKLPTDVDHTSSIHVAPQGDTALWYCITLEDGNQAWTSPAYLFRD